MDADRNKIVAVVNGGDFAVRVPVELFRELSREKQGLEPLSSAMFFDRSSASSARPSFLQGTDDG